MKRLTCLALSIAVMLLLFISPPIMGISSKAQAEESIPSWSGAETETSPAETDTWPAETDTSPAETDTWPAETDTSPAETDTSPAETDAAPAETNTSPAETDTSPAETDTSPAETDTSPAETDTSPAETDAAPAETALLSNESDTLYVASVLASGSQEILAVKLKHAREEVLSILESDSLKQYSSAAVKLNNGARHIFPVTYDFSQLDGAPSGYFLLHGTIEPLDGILIAPELAHVTLPLFLYDPDSPCEIPAVDCHDLNDPMVVIPAGVSHDEAVKYLHRNTNYAVFLEDGIFWEITLTWDWSGVDLNIPGTYEAVGIPVIPDGILLPSALSSPTCAVVVQDASILTLSPPIFNGYYFTVEWTKSTPDTELLHMDYAVGDGEWIEQTGQGLMNLDTMYGQSFNVFYYPEYIDDNFMVFNIPYYFRIEYNGEYSDVLKVLITEDLYSYELIGGDRDGGDRDDQTPPSVTQPPPTTLPPEETPEPEETPPLETKPSAPLWGNIPSGGSAGSPSVQFPGPPAEEPEAPASSESDTQNAATWSGVRIKNYFNASPGLPLVFEKHRIRAAVPADCPVLLNISDTDRLHVEIQPLSADTICLAFSLNDIPLARLPLTVTMPWAKDSRTQNLQVKNETGELTADADYLSQENSVTFTVDRPGVYTILPSAPENTGAPDTPNETQTGAQTFASARAQTAAPAGAQTFAQTYAPAMAQTAARAGVQTAAPADSHDPAAKVQTPSDQPAKNALTMAMSIPAILILGGISVFTFRNRRKKKED